MTRAMKVIQICPSKQDKTSLHTYMYKQVYFVMTNDTAQLRTGNTNYVQPSTIIKKKMLI